MSLFCRGCHKVVDNDVASCPHDAFNLVEANLEFPPSMTIGDLSLNFETCLFPGEHIRSYKVVDSNAAKYRLLRTYASEIIVESHFNEFCGKLIGIENDTISGCIKYGAIESGIFYILSDYPIGNTVSSMLHQHGELNAALTVQIFSQLLDALIILRDQGIYHGNVMPDNCIIVEDPRIPNKLILSGISLPKACFSTNALPEDVSPFYQSREILAGGSPTESTEIYSVGAMMYEALTGLPVFSAGSVEQLIELHASGEVLTLRGVAPDIDIPGMIEEVVLRALNKNQAGRFAKFEDMKKELLYAAKESRIYLPTGATNYEPELFSRQQDKPPEIHREDAEIEAEKQQAEEEKAKEEESQVQKEIKGEVLQVKKSFMALAIVVVVLVIGGASLLLNQGSNEDKAPLWEKMSWEDKISQGDDALKSKKYDEAILSYENALDTAKDIKDDDGRKLKTLRQLVKAYEGKGNESKVKQLKQQMEAIEKSHIKEIEAE